MTSADDMDAQSEMTAALSPSQAGNGHTLDDTGYCLLSLDGGGVRGLSTLYILQGIINRLNYMREEAGLRPRKPCEIFDLIGGTSTGGLIAIMLGRLEMTVDECVDAYTKMMKHVFEKKANRSFIGVLGGVKPRFSSKALGNAISQVLETCGIPIDEKFEDGTKSRCKVFVCTKFQKTNTTTRLRSYRTPAVHDLNPTILEAALATSAAPTYFSDVAINGSKFVDGALGANNPALEVEEEASDLWCEETGDLQPLVKCFISIGTGHPGIRSVSDKGLSHLIETLQKEATETEDTNQKFLGRWRGYVEKGRCFRFNVDHGLDHVRLAEFEEQDLIRAATSTYLQKRGTIGEVRTCVENLRMKEYKPTAEFTRRLKEQTRLQSGPRPNLASSRATPSEISELIKVGNLHLKLPPDRIRRHDLLRAQHNFSQALQSLQNQPSPPPKQVSRLCQKLMETSVRLSMTARRDDDSGGAERQRYADQAREYGEMAVENARRGGDEGMAAQAEFMLGCVEVWRVSVEVGSHDDDGRRERVEGRLLERLEALRRFPRLDMPVYEELARRYLGYLGEGGLR